VPTKERVEKVRKVLGLRQPDLRVVLEEIKNTHNANAVVRTCDAAGILHVDVISSSSEPLPINEAVSTRADKWILFHYYRSTSECLSQLKEKGFKIAVTHLGPDSIPYDLLDYTQSLAIAFGNESEGISNEALQMADYKIKIPMLGMAQSLNLSVSAGIILYEALKQRREKGFFKERRLTSEEFGNYFKKWLNLEES